MIEILVSWVAVLAASLTLFVTLEQLTVTARLRRKVALWRTEAEALPNTYDARILWSLHRSGIAKLIALDAVPTRFPLLLSVLGGGFVFGLFDLGRNVGRLPQEQWTWQGFYHNSEDPLSFFIGIPLLCLLIFTVLHSLHERRRIQNSFLEQEPRLKPQSAVEEERFSKDKKQVQAIASRGLTSLCLGISTVLLSFGVGLMTGAREVAPELPPLLPVWLQIALVVSILGLVYSVSRIIFEPGVIKKHWEHRTPSTLQLP